MTARKTGADFDVVIIGSGPAGMFAALELRTLCPELKIAIFEKGPLRETRTDDNLTSGLGGSGAFSDGKLTMPHPDYPNSLNVGGQLASIVGKDVFLELIEYVNRIYSVFGGRSDIYEKDEEKIKELVYEASKFDLRITPTRVRHFGSDLAPEIVRNIVYDLSRNGIEIYLESPIGAIGKEKDLFLVKMGQGNIFSQGKVFKARYVIAAPGREGADWLAGQTESLGIEILPRQLSVDIGVRVEVRTHTLHPLTDYLYDVKVDYYPKPFEDRVRTFCVCPRGGVVVEKYRGLLTTVNGHSLYEKPLSENTNFAVLVSMKFTEPFREPLKYAGRISELANMLGGDVLVQKLGDLKAGRRSTSERIAQSFVCPSLKKATPGDLGSAMPYRHLTSILGMLEALDKIAPGVNGNNTLLYGNEVKFYSSGIKTSCDLEAAENFFVAGDGAGITRGLMQSSISGVVAARAIAKKEKR